MVAERGPMYSSSYKVTKTLISRPDRGEAREGGRECSGVRGQRLRRREECARGWRRTRSAYWRAAGCLVRRCGGAWPQRGLPPTPAASAIVRSAACAPGAAPGAAPSCRHRPRGGICRAHDVAAEGPSFG
jgi:hypothetical protein